MKKLIISICLLMITSYHVFANVPFRAVISGPTKIGCNSVFEYKVTLQGLPQLSINNVDWYPCLDANISISANNAILTAPGEPMSLVLECDVYVASPYNSYSLEQLHVSLTVYVEEPEFVFSRQNLFNDYISNTSQVPIFGNVDFDGNCNTRDGNCSDAFLDDELLMFNIDLADLDLRVNRGTLKLSVPSGFRLWEDEYRATLLGNSGDNITVNLNDDCEIYEGLSLMTGHVEARNIDLNKNLKFSFNSEDTLLPYKSYGLFNGNTRPSNYNAIRNEVRSKLPFVSDCQWRVIGSAVSAHNNIAYSVVPDPPNYNVFYGAYFCVNKTTPLSPNVYMLVDYNGVLATSMDTFGDRNGSFDFGDIYSFFTHNLWGSMNLVSTINCQVIYLNSYFAAHCYDVTGVDVLYNGWKLFKAKINGVLIAFAIEDEYGISMMFGQANNNNPQPL